LASGRENTAGTQSSFCYSLVTCGNFKIRKWTRLLLDYLSYLW